MAPHICAKRWWPEQRERGERKKGRREKEREGGGEREGRCGFIRVYFSILYPSPVPKDAGKMNDVMVAVTLRLSQQIFLLL